MSKRDVLARSNSLVDLAARIRAEHVVTKSSHALRIGNDAAIGFIRVRHRMLKGGHPFLRARRAKDDLLAEFSESFDLVRAVRVDNKPRHKFVLSLGSQKDLTSNFKILCFWTRAVKGMIDHGLTEDQRWRLLAAMVRKGAMPPTIPQCKQAALEFPNIKTIGELLRWLQSEQGATA